MLNLLWGCGRFQDRYPSSSIHSALQPDPKLLPRVLSHEEGDGSMDAVNKDEDIFSSFRMQEISAMAIAFLSYSLIERC